MANRKAVIRTASLAGICTALGFSIGFLRFNSTIPGPENILADENPTNFTSESEPDTESALVASATAKITPSTKMVYQYYYPEDDVTETIEEAPPYFLVGLTLDNLTEYYENWEIVFFSGEEVIMRMEIPGASSQRYIIGEYQGLLAVFYAEEQNGLILRELTDIPVSSLSPDEQARLREGIYILGEDNLMKALSDYGS